MVYFALDYHKKIMYLFFEFLNNEMERIFHFIYTCQIRKCPYIISLVQIIMENKKTVETLITDEGMKKLKMIKPPDIVKLTLERIIYFNAGTKSIIKNKPQNTHQAVHTAPFQNSETNLPADGDLIEN